jgi:hypothetical protein
MAESNLRTLLASARGSQRDSAIADSEMEAILGVLKGGDEPEVSVNAAQDPAADPEVRVVPDA